jgi:hypothetical protein
MQHVERPAEVEALAEPLGTGRSRVDGEAVCDVLGLE